MNLTTNAPASAGYGPAAPSTLSTAGRARSHALYCLAVTLAVVALKIWIARDIKASPMMADDYEYMNKASYYVHGDLAMQSYPFVNVPAGIAYPMILSPWLLADDPAQRIFVVHIINIILSAVTIFFGSRAISRLSNSDHLLPPLCLAAMPTLFIFSFHALTENFLFALLAILAWLVIDFERTCLQPVRLISLLALTMLLPQVRAPGVAVVPGLVLLVWLHRRGLGPRRAWLTACGLVLISVGPYLLYSALAPTWKGRVRESYYLNSMASVAYSPKQALLTIQLIADQLAYLLISGGYWILPVLVVVGVQVRRWTAGAFRDQWRDFLVLTGVSSVIFLAFCVAHLLMRGSLLESPDWRLYGRYNDPILLFMLLGGIAAAFLLQRPRWEAVILYVLAPICLGLAVGWILQVRWAHAMQHAGIAFFQNYGYGQTTTLVGVAAAIILIQLAPWRRWRVPIWLGALLAFFVLSDMRAIGTVGHPGSARVAAAKIADTQKAADWIHAHLPKSVRLGCDASVIQEHAVSLYSMARVYQVFWFTTYPRPLVMIENDADLQRCDYLFTTADAANPHGLPVAWSDGRFTLYRVTVDLPNALAAGAEAEPTP